MPISKANQRAVNKYKKNNYDRIEITVPKGQRGVFQAHASARGESVNGFINRAILEAMGRDNGAQEAAGGPQGGDMVSLPPETIHTAQEAAQAAGETVPQFVTRAVETQAQRDALARRMGG